MERRSLLSATGAAIAAGLAGCIGVTLGPTETETVSERYEVGPETVVAANTRNGDVSIEPADGERLVVRGRKRATSQDALDRIAVDVVEGERFVVDVSFGVENVSNHGVDLTLELPEGVAVDRASTSNGDVTVADVPGDLRATTSNGTVDVSGVAGVVDLETSNGNVEVRDTDGVTSAVTTNGNVDVELLSMPEDVRCRTSNGNATVRVGADVAATVRLETSNGDVEVRDLPFTATTDERTYVEGTLGDGGEYDLTVESSNGDVVLRPV